MSDSLPERADLDQPRRQAKELRDAGRRQEPGAVSSRQPVEAFVAASVQGRLREAATILDTFPDVASRSVAAAAVLGDARQVARMLAVSPAAAVTIDEGQGWPPLLDVC